MSFFDGHLLEWGYRNRDQEKPSFFEGQTKPNSLTETWVAQIPNPHP